MNRLLIVLLIQSAVAATSEGLSGRWDSRTRSIDGLGTWLELEPAGACTRVIGLAIDGTWKLEGSRLTVTTGPAEARFVQTTSISIAGAVLSQSSGTIKTTRTRVSGPETGMPAIVGVWSYPHPAGGTAYDEYASDGRFLFRLPTETTPCRWAVDGERLTLTEGQQVRTLSWRLAADGLTLRYGAEEETFRRERSGVIGVGSGR